MTLMLLLTEAVVMIANALNTVLDVATEPAVRLPETIRQPLVRAVVLMGVKDPV